MAAKKKAPKKPATPANGRSTRKIAKARKPEHKSRSELSPQKPATVRDPVSLKDAAKYDYSAAIDMDRLAPRRPRTVADMIETERKLKLRETPWYLQHYRNLAVAIVVAVCAGVGYAYWPGLPRIAQFLGL